MPFEPSAKPIVASGPDLASTTAFLQSGKPVPSGARANGPRQSPATSTDRPVSRQPRPPSNLANPSRSAAAAASCITGFIEVRTHRPPA